MEGIGGQRGASKGDASSSSRAAPLTPPPPPRARGPGLPLLPPPGSSPAAVLALPASAASPSGAASPLAPPRPSAAAAAMEYGGGEALLVRRSAGKKRRPAGRDPAAGGDRFRALWRDYHDLLEETEAKKRRLVSANQRKLALLAEVKFLQKKYRSFVKDQSHQRQYKLKKQVCQISSPEASNEASVFADHGVGTEGPSTSRNPNFDLNQDSVMNDEGNNYHGHQGHPELDSFDQVGVEEDMMTDDVKLSVCRDTGNSPAGDDKREIPWQDRLALKA